MPEITSFAGIAGAKAALARIGAVALRTYFRHVPGRFGKQYIWDQIVKPHYFWRTMEIEARSAFGARLLGSFPDTIHIHAYFFGIWEPAITEFYRRMLRSGDVVVDIGANVGTHTLLASHLVGPTGRVHAIEASPQIFARLVRNIKVNCISNVQAYNIAVMDAPRRVTVYLSGAENPGATTVLASEAAKRGATLEALVEGRPLDAIVPLHDLRRARLIKIDVEGAEWFVVQGVRDLLATLRPDVQILIEVTPDALKASGGSLEELIDLFERAGFQPWEISNPYTVDPYIRPPSASLAPLRRRDFKLADLVFRRPQSLF